MRTETDHSEDFVSLYRRAFKEFGCRALGNTCANWKTRVWRMPWRSFVICVLRATWLHGVWLNGSSSAAVLLTRFQSQILRLLAAHRNPENYARSTPLIRHWAGDDFRHIVYYDNIQSIKAGHGIG